VAGKTFARASDTNYITIKYRGTDGAELWVRTYHHLGADAAVAVVADGRGGCFVTGHSSAGPGNSNQDFLTLHYDAAGAVRWSSRLDGVGNGHDYPMAMMLGDSGYLYLTGYSWAGATPQYDYLTVKLDTLRGDTVWTRRYDGTAVVPKADFAYAITQDDSHYVYVTGRAGEQNTWYDATTIKYSSSGRVVWVNRFDAGWLGTDGGGNVKVDKNFNVYVGGIVIDAVDDMYDFLTLRINPDNTVAWYRTFDGRVEDDDSVTAMVVDGRGNVYVTGWTYVFQGDLDWMTIKYSPTGARVWSASHQTFAEDDWPFGMVMDEFGEIYITGFDYAGPDENFCTVKYTEDDVGAFRVVLPQDSFRIGASVVPRVWVRNYGAVACTPFTVRCEIGRFYFDAQVVDTIPAYDSALVTFAPWLVEPVALGPHPLSCYTMLDVDKEPSNDTVTTVVTGVPVWERLPDLPRGTRSKAVLAGAALGFATDSLLFALKGNNTSEFYAYNVRHDAWEARETIPSGSAGKKRVKAGAQLEGDTSGYLYAFKGNNSLEFWKYSPDDRTWVQKRDCPPGLSGRKLKAGANLAYVPRRNALYGCKGNNTDEFYCFDLAGDTWMSRSVVPPGFTRKRVKDGSVMAHDGEGTIYLLKGGTYEFFGYSIERDSWYQKKDIPNSQYSPKRRKLKKGAAAAFDTAYHLLWVMKGGKSGEFWFFDPAGDTWGERPTDTFPTPPGSKLPYTGADLCYGGGKVFALRGNKTLEFWRYNANFPLRYETSRPGTQSCAVAAPSLRLAASPNPFIGRTWVRYSLPGPGLVRLALYDATGRLARALRSGWQAPGEHVVALGTDGLAAGVYLLRLEQVTAGTAKSIKLVMR